MTPARCTVRRRAPRRWPGGLGAIIGVVGLMACSPALDWREFTPEGSGIAVAFPCRPDREARVVSLAGDTVTMQRLLCSADDATFAISFFDAADPARVAPMLEAWRAVTLANLHGGVTAPLPLLIRGMTANASTGAWTVDAQRPDGSALQARLGFFVHGVRLYQAAVISAKPAAAAQQAFFSALRFPP